MHTDAWPHKGAFGPIKTLDFLGLLQVLAHAAYGRRSGTANMKKKSRDGMIRWAVGQ